jgi:hypothetical protein
MAMKKAPAKNAKAKVRGKRNKAVLDPPDAPVIIDDGGSTEIQQLLCTLPGLAGPSKQEMTHGAFQGGEVGYTDNKGNFVSVQSFGANIKEVDFVSQFQTVTFSKVKGNWTLTLSSTSNVAPVQNGVQTVYVVDNAGTIEYVMIDDLKINGLPPTQSVVILSHKRK